MPSQWITSRGTALHVSLYGDAGPTVVFVHGIGGSAAMFSSLVPGADLLGALAHEGLTVVAVDLRGHGRSDGARGHLPFRAAIADIREAVAFASERAGGRVGLVGSGLGAMLGAYAAIEDDRIAALACHTIADLRSIGAFEPRARRRAIAWLVGRGRRAVSVAPFVRLPVRALFPPSDFFEDAEKVRRWWSSSSTTRSYTVSSLASIFLTPDDKPALESLTTPTLVLTGDEDPVVPVAGQHDVVSRLPDAELFVLGGAGHMIPLEHLSQVAPRIAGWMKERL